MSKKAKRREEARMQAMRQTTSQQEAKPVVHHAPHEKEYPFFQKNFKRLMLIPTILLLLAILQIGWQISTTGDFVTKSVSLEGGTTITILADTDADALSVALDSQYAERMSVSTQGDALIVETTMTDIEQIDRVLEVIQQQTGKLGPEQYTVEIIGASLGESFFRQTMIAILVAFVFMSLVIFISFRNPASSTFVILAAVSDILTTLAIFNLLGQELTTAGIAAFLMLIGYSIDTDVLLSTRVLKRQHGSINAAIFNAMGTGLTMSITTAVAALAGFILAKSATLSQIMLIIFIGMCVDMVYTWLQNAPILKWYLERGGA